jgi:hypothetical protein
VLYVHAVRLSAVGAAQVRCQIQLDRLDPVWCWLVDCHADCHDSQLRPGAHLTRCSRYAGRMTAGDADSPQALPRDAELLAFEAGCEDYCKREVDQVEWQGVLASGRPPGRPAPTLEGLTALDRCRPVALAGLDRVSAVVGRRLDPRQATGSGQTVCRSGLAG